jgi:multidrug efflux pump subunit AcrB
VAATLSQQNRVVDAGSVDLQNRRFRIAPTGRFRSPEEIGELVIAATPLESVQASGVQVRSRGELIRIRDVATVSRGILEPPSWEMRFDRRHAQALALANISGGSVVGDIEAIELPQGYELIWDGEHASTVEAQAGLLPGIVPAVVIILFIIVALFNAVRPPLIILLTIPFAFIGITSGLLATQAAFGFVALLGAMSLAGMMIKNAIVLLDQIGIEHEEGESPYQAVVNAAVSRLRPVMLASATTVLGVIPLLKDLFWVSMSVTIMAGLAFGTILVMVLVPVLYATLYRISEPSSG